MPDDTYPDEEDFEVYEDYEEYVDLDEHERARADALRKKARDERDLERHEDHLDEYRYGDDSGEVFEEEDGG